MYYRSTSPEKFAKICTKYHKVSDFFFCRYEVGGGRGTLAMNILDYLKEKDEALYRNTTYTMIEISSAFAELQKQVKSHRLYWYSFLCANSSAST
jgi:SAM-dependent MidA family methyltransferase